MGMVTNWICLIVLTCALRFLGAECMFMISTVVPNKWFIKKRGKVSSFFGVFISLNMAFSAFFALLIDNFGWRYSYFVLSVLIGIIIAFINFFMVDTPSDLNLLPDGEIVEEKAVELETIDNISSLEIES